MRSTYGKITYAYRTYVTGKNSVRIVRTVAPCLALFCVPYETLAAPRILRKCLAFVYDRLQRKESYINARRFVPHCAFTGELATVCRCEDGVSFFNCTADDKQQKIMIFDTTDTNFCMSNGFGKEGEDDGIILLDDRSPAPPSPNVTEPPPPPTWPTPSNITDQQARDECRRVLESCAAYNICREYVNVESMITSCVVNIQVVDA